MQSDKEEFNDTVETLTPDRKTQDKDAHLQESSQRKRKWMPKEKLPLVDSRHIPRKRHVLGHSLVKAT